jgi:hypothetical protein
MTRLFLAVALMVVGTMNASAALWLAQSQTQNVSVTSIDETPQLFTLTFDKYNPANYAGEGLAQVVIEFEATVSGTLTAEATGAADVGVRAVFQLQLFIGEGTDDALGLPESNVSAYLIAIASEPASGTTTVLAGQVIEFLNVTDTDSESLSLTDPGVLAAYVGGDGETLTIDIYLQALASPELFGTPVQIDVDGSGSAKATLRYYYDSEVPIPEPSTASFLGLSAGLLALAGLRRRFSKK